ncbi:hypothetical protein PAL_GLEAN10025632 [Pteropus alecto]|uniref:Uncharacterized protein n=1 Tax=Pteropus alecto TaxID=9402 RepID=L5JM60_PTEAL|nr:hypothetical protein PAL_GLEAN10025632 [Pteropus alecto]
MQDDRFETTHPPTKQLQSVIQAAHLSTSHCPSTTSGAGAAVKNWYEFSPNRRTFINTSSKA